jgi:hypothetical protein
MFDKDAATRVADTLTMISNAPDLNAGIRTQIVALVNLQFPRLTPPEKAIFQQLSGEMSVKGQIGAGVAKGTSPEREKRRAIYLLWMAIGKAQTIDLFIKPRAALAMSMPAASLNAAFSDVMLKAAVVACAPGGQFVYQELCTHPVRFLTQYPIIVLGSPAGGDRLSTAPNGNYQNALNFHFQYEAGLDRFVLGAHADGQLGANYSFLTVSVPAVHWSQVPNAGLAPCNFAGVLGCELTGANFMLTTQFTGCAFNWTSYGGVLRASHISPAGGGVGAYPGGGIALAQQVMLNGAMANAGNTACTVFGGGAGNAPVAAGNMFYPNTVVNAIRWVSIIGVIKGANWRFYMQAISATMQILEARRIM